MLRHASRAEVPDINIPGGDANHYAGPSARHLETANVLWADGHVKAQKVPSFYNLSTAAGQLSPCLQLTGCQ